MTPYISVIVPVYNVEPYLRQCVDSILAQTFSDFELILVDDGSPDGCPAICDEYAARDSRVSVIHQQNAGLTQARRSGLLRASADYVCFVDSDDWVVPHWLETLHSIIEGNGHPDMVVFEHERDTGPTEYPVLAEEGYYDRARMEREILPYMLCDLRRRPFGTQLLPGMLCTKAAKRHLFLDHYIPDDVSITLFEDMAMCYECIYHASSMYVCRQALYVYRRREQSLLTGFRPQFLREVGVCFGYIRSRLGGKAPVLDKEINAAFLRKVLVGAVQLLAHTDSMGEAARDLRQALRDTDIPRQLTFAGLPWDMKLYLLLLKCRLYRAAALVTKYKM